VDNCPKAVLLSGVGMSDVCKAAVQEMEDNLGFVILRCWGRFARIACGLL
jgi:hypothetical protein